MNNIFLSNCFCQTLNDALATSKAVCIMKSF